jgi:hypothetical protein
MIKDCRTILAVKANNNCNNQSNIVTKEHRLYVATLIIKEELDRTWYIDIGAIQHMRFENQSFTNYKIYNNHQLIYLGHNSSHRIQGQRDVTITLISGILKKIPDGFYVLQLRN